MNILMTISIRYVHYTVDVSFNATDICPRTWFALISTSLYNETFNLMKPPVAKVKQRNKQKNGD